MFGTKHPRPLETLPSLLTLPQRRLRIYSLRSPTSGGNRESKRGCTNWCPDPVLRDPSVISNLPCTLLKYTAGAGYEGARWTRLRHNRQRQRIQPSVGSALEWLCPQDDLRQQYTADGDHPGVGYCDRDDSIRDCLQSWPTPLESSVLSSFDWRAKHQHASNQHRAFRNRYGG